MSDLPEKFDKSFYTLAVIGYWILVNDVLDTEEGRTQVKGAFRDAMLAGSSSYEELISVPEIAAALEDIDRVQNGESVGDVSRSRMFETSEGR